MPVNHTNIVQAPDFAVKIAATMRDGQVFHGTGFSVTHAGRDWLVTCRHNIELEDTHFAGRNDLSRLQIVRHGTLFFDDTRRVVGVRVNGRIADAVAIELREGEYSRSVTPGFDTAITMSLEGEHLPETITIRGPAPEYHQVNVAPKGYLALQGFAGDQDRPTTLKAAELHQMPDFLHDWMIRFLPETTPGFSGGPVLRMTHDRVSLLGITTHRFSDRVEIPMDEGRIATIGVTAGAAAPIAPLLDAMNTAALGHSITDISL